jgi:hypothetical protein
MKIDIFNRHTGALQFTAEIDAVVLEIDDSEILNAAAYRRGQTVHLQWNLDWRVERSGGIHFYLTETHK